MVDDPVSRYEAVPVASLCKLNVVTVSAALFVSFAPGLTFRTLAFRLLDKVSDEPLFTFTVIAPNEAFNVPLFVNVCAPLFKKLNVPASVAGVLDDKVAPELIVKFPYKSRIKGDAPLPLFIRNVQPLLIVKLPFTCISATPEPLLPFVVT